VTAENSPYKYLVRKDTSNYTEADIICEIFEDRAILKDLGIVKFGDVFNLDHIAFSNRFTTCHAKTSYDGRTQKFTLTFGTNYMKYASPEAVHTTIFHEVLHTLPGCMSHTGTWKKYANVVSNHLRDYGINITRCTNDVAYERDFLAQKRQDRQAKVITFKNNCYAIYCPDCKRVIKVYERKCKTYNNIIRGMRYWHDNGKCHSNVEPVIVNYITGEIVGRPECVKVSLRDTLD
jgi:thiol-disulfide isomerase/thioredoxin